MRKFRFACQSGCTRCCDQRGFVYLTEADAQRAAGFLRLTPEEFERRYVYRTRQLRRLRKPRHSQCQFLTGSGCSIHTAKPTQCRTFPFWPQHVGDRESWAALGEKCPGVGQGQLIPLRAVLSTAAEHRRAYPFLYE
jgi:uncharacterized protein